MKAKWVDVSDENSGREAWRCEIAEHRPLEDNPFCDVSYGLKPCGMWRVLFLLNADEGRYSDDITTGAEARQIATALVEVFERMWP
jgi:hypothetical protein